MRKSFITPSTTTVPATGEAWIDLETAGRVELTSEDPAHPFENALLADPGVCWRAAEPGSQIVRLVFDEPQRIRRIRLMFRETETPRTQEYTLRWAPDEDAAPTQVLRQQFNFTPPYTQDEIQTFSVELDGVRVLELSIAPALGGGEARASLTSIQVG